MVASEWIGTTIDGRYEVGGVLGVGGMGTVLRARHRYTHADVAVKVMHAEVSFDAQSVQRFLGEARAPATIGHPAIVEIIDANVLPSGALYIVMELLAGRSLRAAMAPGMPAEQVRRVGLELLDALAAAHRRGFIHRDLKPENVQLVPPGDTVKLLDFGIAKVLGSASGTQRGRMLGTLEYMAPEQLADASAVDGRADLWAVGVILYEAIAGVRPLAGATREQKFAALAADEPMPIEELAPVTPEAAAFFRRALARDPAERFASAEDMAAHLRPLAIERGTAQGAGSAAGPTLASGPRGVQPTHTGTPPTSTQAETQPTPRREAPPVRRSRAGLAIAIAVAVAAIVIAIVIATRSTRETTAVADAAAPPAPRPDAAPTTTITPERCTQACAKLSACGLAQRTCQRDCENRLTPLACVESSDGCQALATCILTWVCRDAGIELPAKGLGCVDAITCETRCPPGGTCVCNCIKRLQASAAPAFARLYTCRIETQGDSAAFEKRCTPLMRPCAVGE